MGIEKHGSITPRQELLKSSHKPAARPGSPRGLYTLAVGSILGRGGAEVHTAYTEPAAAVQDRGSRRPCPASLSFPPAGQGCCGRLCCSLPSAAANICACGLPSPPPSSCASSLSPEMAIQMGVQTADRCSGCFPTCPGMGLPTPPHQDLGSLICKPPMARRCAPL